MFKFCLMAEYLVKESAAVSPPWQKIKNRKSAADIIGFSKAGFTSLSSFCVVKAGQTDD